MRTLRGDRMFRAGATPCSREDASVDRGLQDCASWRFWPRRFLETEKAKYLQQLEAYAGVMRKVHGENLPLRLALYYPLLTKLVWW